MQYQGVRLRDVSDGRTYYDHAGRIARSPAERMPSSPNATLTHMYLKWCRWSPSLMVDTGVLLSEVRDDQSIRLCSVVQHANMVSQRVPSWHIKHSTLVRHVHHAVEVDEGPTADLTWVALMQICPDHAAAIQSLRGVLEPVRQTLSKHRWLGGDSPNYADFTLAGMFLVGSSSQKSSKLGCIQQRLDAPFKCRCKMHPWLECCVDAMHES